MILSPIYKHCLLLAGKHTHCMNKAWLLDAMTVVSEYTFNVSYKGIVEIGTTVSISKSMIEGKMDKLSTWQGQIICINEKFLGIVSGFDDVQDLVIEVLQEVGKPIYDRLDVFEFGVTDSEIFSEVPFCSTDVGLTNVGRFLENIIVLGYSCDYSIPYVNTKWSTGMVFGLLSKLAVNKQIEVHQLQKAIDNFFFLNHLTELCVPTMTEKSLSTHPDVPKVKAEFIKEHAHEMDNPLVASQLEKKLEALDAEYLKGDPSVRFFDGLGGKSWNLHRKKMFLTVGCIDSFEVNEGNYDFIPNSLMEGWTKSAFPTICNEIRKGSYNRGVETAKGGAETKLVMRVFQDLEISAEDCGTKRTIEADFNRWDISGFVGRTIVDNGKEILLTTDNIANYSGKQVKLYSPLTCATPKDMCYKCCGVKARELGARFVGIQTVKITSRFMLLAMKNMHGTTLKVRNIDFKEMFL